MKSNLLVIWSNGLFKFRPIRFTLRLNGWISIKIVLKWCVFWITNRENINFRWNIVIKVHTAWNGKTVVMLVKYVGEKKYVGEEFYVCWWRQKIICMLVKYVGEKFSVCWWKELYVSEKFEQKTKCMLVKYVGEKFPVCWWTFWTEI